MNVYDILQRDHQGARELIGQLKALGAGEAEQRNLLFERLTVELTIHLVVKEKYLYPHIWDAAKTSGKGLEAREEHKAAKFLLAELADGDKDTEEWAAALNLLEERIERHFREEEEHVFPRARKLLSKAEAESLGLEMEEHKSRYLALEG